MVSYAVYSLPLLSLHHSHHPRWLPRIGGNTQTAFQVRKGRTVREWQPQYGGGVRHKIWAQMSASLHLALHGVLSGEWSFPCTTYRLRSDKDCGRVNLSPNLHHRQMVARACR